MVLTEIGYAGTTGTPWQSLFDISTGNIIITALGFVPGASMINHSARTLTLKKGYYVTVLTTEKLGRKFIQVMGFLMEALFCRLFRVPWRNVC